MNVTEDLMRKYLVVFHETYKETVKRFLTEENASRLSRYPFLRDDTSVVGYVSTNFGAGFEYLASGSAGITMCRSSARIEDMFTRAPTSLRKSPHAIFRIGASNATIMSSTMEGTFPFRFTSEIASVRFIDVRFRARRWERTVAFAELYGNRTAEFWSEVNAVSRAKDEVLVAMLDLCTAKRQNMSIGEYLKTSEEKMLLLLGDYKDHGRKRLDLIKRELARLGYAPILLDEIPDDLNYNLSQKAVTVGSLARFVVFDDSSKSGHLVELVHAHHNDWVTIILREEGSQPSYMTLGLSAASKNVLGKDYTSQSISAVIGETVQWAENRLEELKRTFAGLYPWRRDLEE